MDIIGLALAQRFPELTTDPAIPFATVAAQPYRRWSAGVSVLPDGNVLITGGSYYYPAGNYTDRDNRVYRYNVASNTWSSRAVVPGALELYNHGQSTLLDGTVLTTGGGSGTSYLQTNSYDPVANVWTTKAAIPQIRYGHIQETLDDGRVFVAGGWAGGSTGTKSWFYNPTTNTWDSTTGASLPAGFVSGGGSAKLTDGSVMMAGGGGTTTYTSYMYDPVGNVWTTKADFVGARGGSARMAPILGNNDGVKAIVLGGSTHSGTGIYDKATNTWSVGPNMAHSRSGFMAAALPDGRIFAAGSDNSSDTTPQQSAEIGRPARQITEPKRAALIAHLVAKN